MYQDGILFYILEGQLRILDLHASATEERVIHIRTLLDDGVPESVGTQKYDFQLIHYSHGFLSCRYTHTFDSPEHWLVVIDFETGRIASQELDSAYKLFVRNNEDFLVFGTHSEFGEDDYRRWVLGIYDLQNQKWLDSKVHLVDLVGSDVGNTVCFEIFDGYFYGLSNQNSWEVEGSDWTSYYYCFRFPLACPTPDTTQMPKKESMIRRVHGEGTVDDRWTFLRLERNQQTSSLQILESRKEWFRNSSTPRRTYYTKKLVMPDDEHGLSGVEGSSNPPGYDGDVDIVDPTPKSEGERIEQGQKRDYPKTTRHASDVHPGDDGAKTLMFTLSKSHIRCYFSACSTYMDLVDDPSPADPNARRLRIRAGARRLKPLEARQARAQPIQVRDPLYPIEDILQNYVQSDVALFPPDEDVARPDPQLEELHWVLSPPPYPGHIIGTWDDRSLVYSCGSLEDDMQAICFVGFDPTIRLKGLKTWRGGWSSGSGRDYHDNHAHADWRLACEEAPTSNQDKGKGKETEVRNRPLPVSCTVEQDFGAASSVTTCEEPPGMPWMWQEPAMHTDISRSSNLQTLDALDALEALVALDAPDGLDTPDVLDALAWIFDVGSDLRVGSAAGRLLRGASEGFPPVRCLTWLSQSRAAIRRVSSTWSAIVAPILGLACLASLRKRTTDVNSK